MAKSNALGDNLYVAGYDLSGDSNTIALHASQGTLDVTGMNKSANERILGGPRNGEISWNAFFNTAANQAHSRYKLLPTADVIMSYYRGTALGGDCASMVSKQVNYDGSRGTDGGFTFALQAQSDGYGLEWGVSGTAGIRNDTTATNGSSVDLGAAFGTPSFGMQAYLHVFAFTGTSCTVKIQSSSDNGAGDAFADVTGGGFTAATGITSQRIATSSTLAIERYLRVVTTGTFSVCNFAVTMHPNIVSVVF
jgi:hypothetical protein